MRRPRRKSKEVVAWLLAWDACEAYIPVDEVTAVAHARLLARRLNPNLPLPTKQLKAFIPLLHKHGLLHSSEAITPFGTRQDADALWDKVKAFYEVSK